jgi:hypothetical protein
LARQHDKGCRPPGSELPGGFVVGAVDLVKQRDLEVVTPAFQVSLNQAQMQPGGSFGYTITTRSRCFEREALGAQFFHVEPD